MKNYREYIDRIKTRHSLTIQQLSDEEERLKRSQTLYQNVLEAQAIAQTVSQAIQQKAHVQIAGVVTRCLEAVFGKSAYQFKINFEQKRGKTEAILLFEREGKEIDPISSSGGGVIDVASFALRLSCLLLTKPPVRRVLILDEPFKFVSALYRDNIRQLLESLSEELKVQFIIVTHIQELVTGNVIEMKTSRKINPPTDPIKARVFEKLRQKIIEDAKKTKMSNTAIKEIPCIYDKCLICHKPLQAGIIHKCSKKAIAKYEKDLSELDNIPESVRSLDDRLKDGFRIR